ncbi:MAG: hypothetical protein AVDCRST_MAG78-3016 [uncultured Rubrobacteraceae bacterium]|uniref:Uncharacterized protein n=1 Tax=uncultured Rubrobacteraceae bacterium TaxID=349277 RepID=A0A6J4QKW4_9ACTN|nr:MAG: hypothetical protein AVDCRST_MAG78-3016 [uncultured Rubrobacteraceae bacterium]
MTADPGIGGFGTTGTGAGDLRSTTDGEGPTGAAVAGPLPGRGAVRTPCGEPVGESTGSFSPTCGEGGLFSPEATGPGTGSIANLGYGSAGPRPVGAGAGGGSTNHTVSRGPGVKPGSASATSGPYDRSYAGPGSTTSPKLSSISGSGARSGPSAEANSFSSARAGSGSPDVTGSGSGWGEGPASRSSVCDGDESAGGVSISGPASPTSVTGVRSGPITAAYTSGVGCCCARTSPAARTKAPTDRMSTTKMARAFRPRRPVRPIVLYSCPNDKSFKFPISPVKSAPKGAPPQAYSSPARRNYTGSLPPDVVWCQHFLCISRVNCRFLPL